MRTRPALHPTVGFSAAAALAAGALALPPSFELIEPNRYCTAFGVSADGSVVVGGTGAGSALPYRWEKGVGFQILSTAGAGAAKSVSADGSVVVGWHALNSVQHGFRWSHDTGLVRLGDLPGGPDFSEAVAVSADGRVILGTGRDESHSFAMRWTEESGWVSLGSIGDPWVASAGSALSADGRVAAVIAFTDTQNVTQAARWDLTFGMEGLGDLPGGPFVSAATAVNADGSVVVGFGRRSSGAYATEAFIWRQGWDEIQGLGGLPGAPPYSVASGVSADGAIVVGDGWDTDGDRTAFVWDEGNGMRRLSDVLADMGVSTNGIRLRRAMAVSPDGRTIVGIAMTPDGQGKAFRVYLGSACPADFDDGTRRGVADGAVGIDDLLYFIRLFELGNITGDLDDGSFQGVRDGAVTIEDLIYFLTRFEMGC